MISATCLAVMMVTGSGTALAAQVQGVYGDLNWNSPASPPVTLVNTTTTVEQDSPSTFWATNWLWTGGAEGGYLGIQTNGELVDGTVSNLAIFSVWGAIQASGACEPFGGEGTGMSCRIPIPLTVGTAYGLQLDRGQSDSAGTWWSVQVTAGATTQLIGSIETVGPSAEGTPGPTSLTTFVEYFGQGSGCSDIASSSAVFTNPTMSWASPSGMTTASTTFTGTTLGNCAVSSPGAAGYSIGLGPVVI